MIMRPLGRPLRPPVHAPAAEEGRQAIQGKGSLHDDVEHMVCDRVGARATALRQEGPCKGEESADHSRRAGDDDLV
eukprot:CAMPEP_0185204348 /NCGR_PEP_ID=MMETSP1140-20130426/54699_1 /TAXON_ID=298111 /ORGANISM="Pavlova sp., Strain CCMP459" /LENGTH=75 /DNA_ID=CAMNT_0027771893 /DNA_START=78 /DNA_END=305 /DNA_ORIENTATION=+